MHVMNERMPLDEFLMIHPDCYSEIEGGLLLKALHTAVKCHSGQLRGTGHQYHEHVLAVAIHARRQNLGIDAECSALLHDVIEDCGITVAVIRTLFGLKVAEIVDGLSVDKNLDKAFYWEKIALVAEVHFEVIILKLLDRLHNLTTIYGFRDRARQERFLEETLGPLHDLTIRCRSLIPKDRLADYDDLVNEVHTLATKLANTPI